MLTAAFDDAEAQARRFTATVLAHNDQNALSAAADDVGITEPTIRHALAGQLDTVVGSCLDIDHSPFNAGRCSASFLTCLRCPNALILERHLPMLLALADHLQVALDATAVQEWVRRLGTTWITLVRLILPQFTEAQRQRAAAHKPASLGPDLLDGPRELPEGT